MSEKSLSPEPLPQGLPPTILLRVFVCHLPSPFPPPVLPHATGACRGVLDGTAVDTVPLDALLLIIQEIGRSLWDDGRAFVALGGTCRSLRNLVFQSPVWRQMVARRFGPAALPPAPAPKSGSKCCFMRLCLHQQPGDPSAPRLPPAGYLAPRLLPGWEFIQGMDPDGWILLETHSRDSLQELNERAQVLLRACAGGDRCSCTAHTGLSVELQHRQLAPHARPGAHRCDVRCITCMSWACLQALGADAFTWPSGELLRKIAVQAKTRGQVLLHVCAREQCGRGQVQLHCPHRPFCRASTSEACAKCPTRRPPL